MGAVEVEGVCCAAHGGDGDGVLYAVLLMPWGLCDGCLG